MPGRNLNLLSLDGGGIRGLSSLQILKQLMENIAFLNGFDTVPKPCDYFDMIGGTSTGGSVLQTKTKVQYHIHNIHRLIAIMLGRLKMDIESCIEAYVTMSDRIFQKAHHRLSPTGKVQGKFDAQELEKAIKQIIVDNHLEEDALLMDAPDAPCKVYVASLLVPNQTSFTSKAPDCMQCGEIVIDPAEAKPECYIARSEKHSQGQACG